MKKKKVSKLMRHLSSVTRKLLDPIADAGVCYCTDVPENLGAAAK